MLACFFFLLFSLAEDVKDKTGIIVKDKVIWSVKHQVVKARILFTKL